MHPSEARARRHLRPLRRVLRRARSVPRALASAVPPWAAGLLWAVGMFSASGLLPASGMASADAAGGTWQWPLLPRPAVISAFAAPLDPYGPGLRGVDLAATVGQSVHSAAAGIVAFAGLVAGTPVISVDHGSIVTTYEPVLAGVRAGQRVSGGAALGTVAALPRRCGIRTCLHWGAYLEQSTPRHYLDPLALIGVGPVRLLPDSTELTPPRPSVPAHPGSAPQPARQPGGPPTPVGAAVAQPPGAAAVAPTEPGAATAQRYATVTTAAGPPGRRRTHRLAVAATVAVLLSGSALLAPVLVEGATGRPGRRAARPGRAGTSEPRGRDR